MPDRDPRQVDEVTRILDLVAAGEITADAAGVLLDALAERPVPPPVPAQSQSSQRVTATAAEPSARTERAPRTYRVTPAEKGVARSSVRDVARDIRHEVRGEMRSSGRELSRELRRFSREARRISHEASKVSNRAMRDALREAKEEIKHAFRLSVDEARRAVEDVEVELKRAFADGTPATRDSTWLSSLARLGIARDQVKQVVQSMLEQPVEPGDRVSIRNFAGDVSVTGWDESKVEVRAARTAWGTDPEMAQDRAESMPLEAHRVDGQVTVEADSPVPSGIGLLNLQRMSSDLVIMVPRRLPLTITTKGGDVIVTAYAGALTITTTQGDAVLDTVSGPVEVETVSGDIELRECTAPTLSLTSVSGEIVAHLTAQPAGEYVLRSAEGDVVVNLIPAADVECELETVRGDIDAGGAMAVMTRGPGTMRGMVNGAAGRADAPPAKLRIVTINGDASVA